MDNGTRVAYVDAESPGDALRLAAEVMSFGGATSLVLERGRVSVSGMGTRYKITLTIPEQVPTARERRYTQLQIWRHEHDALTVEYSKLEARLEAVEKRRDRLSRLIEASVDESSE